MSTPVTYMAASVPRFIRQTKLSYLPMNCVIGSHITPGTGGSKIIYDVVMLQVQQFQRMRMNAGLQHVATPMLNAGPALQSSFIPSDTKQVTVPVDEPQPELWARAYFIKMFGLTEQS